MAIQIRRGTDSGWEANKSNIVAGEPAVTTDTGRFFVGTGNGTFAEFPNMDRKGVRSLGSINPSSSRTFTVPNTHFGIMVLHGSLTALTAILEVYCNASGNTYVRVMAVPETAATRNFEITTSTNGFTVANTHTSAYITSIHYIAVNSDLISVT